MGNRRLVFAAVLGASVILTLAIGALVRGAMEVNGPGAPGAGPDAAQEDNEEKASEARRHRLMQLADVFGNGRADIFMAGGAIDMKQPAIAGAKVSGIVDAPGKMFYRATLPDGTVLMLDPAQIVVVRQIK
jgi:hypothetical protein